MITVPKIETKQDFSGDTFYVRIPADRVDIPAMKTMLADMPDFAVPFQSKQVDDTYEFVYSPGIWNKIAYFNKVRKPDEYIQFWLDLLQPFVQCQDWFMQPFYFVLDMDYVFFDNAPDAACQVKYLYIPTLDSCADTNTLKKMVELLLENNYSTDKNLENIMLRALSNFSVDNCIKILQEYKTKEMLEHPPQKPASAAAVPPLVMPPPQAPAGQGVQPQNPKFGEPPRPDIAPQVEKIKSFFQQKPPPPAAPVYQPPIANGAELNNIDIAIHPLGQKLPIPDSKKHKPAEEKISAGQKLKSLFAKNKKKDANVEIVAGAASEQDGYITKIKPHWRKERQYDSVEAHLPLDDLGPELTNAPLVSMPVNRAPQAPQQTPPQPPPQAINPQQNQQNVDSTDPAATMVSRQSKLYGVPYLRFVGKGASFPQQIYIKMEMGESFSIGREDITINRPQNEFEFPANTQAVSRKHAVIEQGPEGGYTIRDLNSRYGTFINYQRISAGSHPLHSQDRVSFGNEGAEYIFERELE